MVGRDLHAAGEFFFAGSRVSALKIARFNFGGASDHRSIRFTKVDRPACSTPQICVRGHPRVPI
jgi:hypothetical protein